ncbi:GyrI-like domain-containing protein [Flavobacterium sp. NRK1]|uniref:GyrI-like domain-containing protein n=1 Tax=Flavobacterium sp. NRK1 TaxID=2954929 RepID=UPI002093BD2F|nr:GyrI-like domain-containing protein [Flavobacterium sp. NRK1]MCO6146589.1 GyrI-like domain-containing protein [Flavobacterium sp. NRK1]
MKIVKYIFLLLVLSVVAVSVFIATQDGKYDIKKERIIKAPKMVLYNYINEYKNWENIGILTGSDTTSVFSFSENTSGRGAEMSWKKGENTGEIITTNTIENDSIIQKAIVNDLDSEISWSFTDTLKSTKVTVRVKGQLSFSEKANAILRGNNVNKELEASLQKGLENLDSFLVKELTEFDIKVNDKLVTKSGTFYLGQSVTSKIEDITKKAYDIFPKLLDFMKENKIVKSGSPFILYKAFDKEKNTASYMVCIPIRDEMFTSPGSEFEGGRLQSFTALKTTLKGDYSHLKKAWDTANNYITEKGLEENTTGTYLELFTKNIQKTKRPSEWVTDIYIPIGTPTILPVIENPASQPANSKPTVNTPVTIASKPAVKTAAWIIDKPITAKSKAGNDSGNSTSTKPPVNTASKPASPKPETNP